MSRFRLLTTGFEPFGSVDCNLPQMLTNCFDYENKENAYV